MYSTRPGQPSFAAGHGGAGVTAPALRWFLAEGATGNFFDLYVLIGNPNTTAVGAQGDVSAAERRAVREDLFAWARSSA